MGGCSTATGFCAGLADYAGIVAVSAKDETKRADGYRVLKLVWGTGTGGESLGSWSRWS